MKLEQYSAERITLTGKTNSITYYAWYDTEKHSLNMNLHGQTVSFVLTDIENMLKFLSFVIRVIKMIPKKDK